MVENTQWTGHFPRGRRRLCGSQTCEPDEGEQRMLYAPPTHGFICQARTKPARMNAPSWSTRLARA